MKKGIFFLVFLLVSGYSLFSQTYCTPTSSAAPPVNNFYTHFLKFSFGEINQTYNAPWNNNSTVFYFNYTYISTDLVPGTTYPLRMTMGNGGNTQTVALWIDFNKNGTFETTERLYTRTDTQNKGDHILRTNITIPSNAALGSTRLRIGTYLGYNPPNPCTNNTYNSMEFQDYTVNFVAPAVQSYVSSTSSQTVFDEVTKSSTHNQILNIKVETNPAGTLSPLLIDTFYFSTLGTTNPTEISRVKLWYTGKSTEFQTTNLIGSTSGSPGSYFKIPVNQLLASGANYFWLTYDITSTAILGNAIDARCNGIYIRAKRIPSVVDPNGQRNIGYAVSVGNKSAFVYIRRVMIGSIDNTPWNTYYGTGYSNYLYLSDTIKKNRYHNVSVETGNGVNNNYSQAWIDFNRDGVFDPYNERVLFDSITTASVGAPVYGPVSDSFQVPLNSPVGPTRMRVTSHYDPGQAPWRIPAKPNENPVEVGEVEDYTLIIGDNGQPASKFTASTACLGSPTYFYDQSYTFGNYQINNWVWDFGDGDTSHQQNPQHTYKNPGVYNVKLTTKTNFGSCIPGMVTQSVKVNNPVADFSFSSNIFKSNVLFSDETSGGVTTSWYWDFGDPQSYYNNFSNAKSPTHSFDTVGWYTITFIATTDGGCVDTVKKTIYFDSTIAPIADFSASSFNPYYLQEVNLQDLSINVPTNWEWKINPSTVTFLQGTTSKSKNPLVSFNTIGTYSVKLIVYNSAGIDSISKNITTKNYTKPAADFTANNTVVKAGQLVSFTDLSTNDPNTWQWLFGDNDTGRVQHPLHAYANTGTFSVQLTSSNPAGSSTVTKANYIKVSNEYDLCDNDAASSNLFTGFLFDDGGKNGNYKNNISCGFLIEPICSGPITLRFTMFDLDPSDFVLVYDGVNSKGKPLFTGNGFTGTSLPPSIIAYSGAMFIQLITNYTDVAQGFAAYWTATPNIAPLANIIADTIGYINGPVNFLNGTSLGTGNQYQWDYTSDGKTDDISFNGRHKYDSLGYYTATLTAQNCKGSNSKTHTIHIIMPTKAPVADFIADRDTVVELEKVHFFDQSTMGPTSWLWEINSAIPFSYFFTDGTSDTSQNPVIQFFEVGPYDISLTATNMIGTSATTTKTNFIYLKPKGQMCFYPYSSDYSAGRIFDSGGEDLNYQNGSTVNSCFFLINPCADKITLNFKTFDYASGDFLRVYDGSDNTGKPFHSGSGFSSNSLPPNYLVAESGAMFIEEVTNLSGTASGFVADWSSKPHAIPKSKFECFDTAYTGGYVMQFENKSIGYVEKYYWDYDFDGIPDDSSTNGRYVFTKTGIHNIQLTAINCSGSHRYTKNIMVVDPTQKPVSDFIADRLSCDTSDIITFKDLTKYGPNTYKWRFSPSSVTYMYGTDSSSARPFVKFINTGKYDVTLITSNAFGTDTITKPQYINVFSYCTPQVGQLLNDFGISKVVIKDIYNASGCGQIAYTNYSSEHSATLELGGTYDYQVNSVLASGSYNRRIWIDFDQDGTFNDSTEKVATTTAASNKTTWTGTFKVAPTAKLGQTRMRIGVGTWGYPLTPCNTNYFGEYEDYRINITSDVTAPEITLKGYNPTLTEIGYTYTDSGATAWDAVDGDISSQIIVVSNVNSSKLGKYTLTYNVSDVTGNDAEEVRRTVYVTPDKTPPVVTLNGANPMTVGVYTKFTDPGATANDNMDGNISNLIVVQSNVDTSRVDTFQVLYSAYDKTGNFSEQVARTVYVKDTTAPVITLKGPDTIFHEKGISYTDSGATVTDNYYKPILVQVIPTNNIDIAYDGWYWYRYDAIDPSGNYAKAKIRVVKVGHPEGIDDHSAMNKTAVYPNPSTGQFTLSLDLNRKYDVTVDIINPLGKVVQHSMHYGVMKKEVGIDLSSQSQGIYLIRIKAGNNSIYEKVTIID
jgi:PKD repeat protein